METSFLWFGVFSGSFGVQSIVLCKCSGKYIDIYFKLKITFYYKITTPSVIYHLSLVKTKTGLVSITKQC